MELTHVANLTAWVTEPVVVGEAPAGTRRLIPILRGEVLGPALNGRILGGGADFQIVRRDGVIDLEARYVIETDDGALIYVENRGLRHGPPDAVYFRTTPRFETPAPQYQWLTKHVFLATGTRLPDRVELSIFQVM
jgi:hypothetical protein